MASLTRETLSAMGIEEVRADEIIKIHRELVDEIKDERDKYKAEAKRLPNIQKELDELKEAAKNGDRSPYKVKYEALLEEKEALQNEFDQFKADQTAKETKAQKQALYKELLKEIGVSEKRLDSILKVSDIDALELDDGKFKDSDKLKEEAKKEWADFIVTEGEKGTHTETPPENNGGQTRTPSFAALRAAEYHNNLYGGKEE